MHPFVFQPDPPLSPRETLPTMYDLPSEDPEEPGLPDEFHDLQPQLLSRTLRLVDYASDRTFTGTNLNLYYDARHLQWHKRPDWFLVLDVPRLYDGNDMRSSYVVWQEAVHPFVIVELLSPGTEKEDLGENAPPEPSDSVVLESANGQPISEKPPRKWDVYEKILRVPYYIVFSRYTNQLRFFQLTGGRYQEQPVDPDRPRLWIPALKLGLGLWQGSFEGINRLWLRWYDEQDNWALTDTEYERQQAEQQRQQAEYEQQQAEQERQRAEQERQRAIQAETQLKQVVLNLIQSGMTIAQVAQLTGLSEGAIKRLTSEEL
ncbi:Uma2 family endonuclease [Phormidesmis sp. 146-35]